MEKQQAWVWEERMGAFVFSPIEERDGETVVVEGLAVVSSFEAMVERGATSFHKWRP